MKRRLSVAIALVANPKIVFLDEPTTGLDPETRRGLWDTLSQLRGKRAMVLTTHSMEEADVLCSRIGIVNDGILRCIGPQVRLKTLYGGGYHLFVNCLKAKQLRVVREKEINRLRRGSKMEDEMANGGAPSTFIRRMATDNDDDLDDHLNIEAIHAKVREFVSQLMPQAMMLREFNGNFVYQIPIEGFNAEKLFNEMEKHKEKLKIADWGISQCSLEDVFTRICDH